MTKLNIQTRKQDWEYGYCDECGRQVEATGLFDTDKEFDCDQCGEKHVGKDVCWECSDSPSFTSKRF